MENFCNYRWHLLARTGWSFIEQLWYVPICHYQLWDSGRAVAAPSLWYCTPPAPLTCPPASLQNIKGLHKRFIRIVFVLPVLFTRNKIKWERWLMFCSYLTKQSQQHARYMLGRAEIILHLRNYAKKWNQNLQHIPHTFVAPWCEGHGHRRWYFRD